MTPDEVGAALVAVVDGAEASVSDGGQWARATVDVPAAAWPAALTGARDTLSCDFFDWLAAVDEEAEGYSVVAHVWSTAAVRAAGAHPDRARRRRRSPRSSRCTRAPPGTSARPTRCSASTSRGTRTSYRCCCRRSSRGIRCARTCARLPGGQALAGSEGTGGVARRGHGEAPADAPARCAGARRVGPAPARWRADGRAAGAPPGSGASAARAGVGACKGTLLSPGAV